MNILSADACEWVFAYDSEQVRRVKPTLEMVELVDCVPKGRLLETVARPDSTARIFDVFQLYLQKSNCFMESDWQELAEKLEKLYSRCVRFHETEHFHFSREIIKVLDADTTDQLDADDCLKEIFAGLVNQWHDTTGGYSITRRRYAHPTYQAILGLGPEAVPLILREMQDRPDWWFEALTALAKPSVNPVKPDATFEEATNAWLDWGRKNNLL